MTAHPELATAVNYDPEAVTEDLDNVATLQSLLTELGELKRRIDDTVLLWSAEAYQQSLQAYGAARALERSQPELRQVVAPLAGLYEGRRGARAKKDPSGG
jgi:hypothetical protein